MVGDDRLGFALRRLPANSANEKRHRGLSREREQDGFKNRAKVSSGVPV
jgi:hypothetical protein